MAGDEVVEAGFGVAFLAGEEVGFVGGLRIVFSTEGVEVVGGSDRPVLVEKKLN